MLAAVAKAALPPLPDKQINLRMSEDLIEAIDACVEDRNRVHPLVKINRSDFIRDALVKAVQEASASSAKPRKAGK